MSYYVRVNDAEHSGYPIYQGEDKGAAQAALEITERVLYGILATADVTHNLTGKHERLEWNQGCPPDESTFRQCHYCSNEILPQETAWCINGDSRQLECGACHYKEED